MFTSISISANAALVDNGNGTVTDTDAGLMWMQDANHIDTTGYDDALYGHDTWGMLNWYDAMDWADNLVFAGYDDWRLPVTLQPDLSCSEQDSYWGSYGAGCTGSEMGHLYYSEGISTLSPSPFYNFHEHASIYWSSTVVAGTNNDAYDFDFKSGYTTPYDGMPSHMNVWVVRDIAVAPEPISSVLFITGGTFLAGRRYIKKTKKA